MHALLHLVLLVFVMLVAVPAFTGGAVAVPGGFFRGLFAVVAVAVINVLLWMGIAALSLGGAILANIVTFGLVSLLINGAALLTTSRLAPSLLYVRDYWAAIGGAAVLTVASYVIQMLLH